MLTEWMDDGWRVCEWMDGWVDEWVSGWEDGWMEKQRLREVKRLASDDTARKW